MDSKIQKLVLTAQRTEITECLIYNELALRCKDANNAAVLHKISDQEKSHYNFWKSKSGVDIAPDKKRVWRMVLMAKLLGFSFVLKEMERREGTGSRLYDQIAAYIPETKRFAEEENIHEKEILDMLDEERLKYVGSVVLGLNDALVELTGSLAGFTLALGNTKVITLAGLVTGISAALSMAASDYLSSKTEGDVKAKKSAIYTGVAYFFTVIFLILPFLLLSSKLLALAITLVIAIFIIFAFNYYISVAKDMDFKSRFWEMTFISLGVAAFSFLVGWGLKVVLGVDI